jgi:glycosyltransferase involved in cell wall biosynthesis
MQLSLTIVVPVYNEASFLPEGLPRLIAAVESVGAPFVIRLVENGSTDGTALLARSLSEGANVIVAELRAPPELRLERALRHTPQSSIGR